MRISEVAQAAGVGVETIRYYERRGLIRQPPKPARGWRRYDEGVVRRVQFVKRAQELGFTLDDIEELLRLRTTKSPRTCARVSVKARAKIDEIDAKIRDLASIREVLSALAEACPGDGEGENCPILDALDA